MGNSKNKKNKQHIVPRTYLKHWKISSDQSFVYGIDLSNRYRKYVQKFGLNHKAFMENKYYNHESFENAYIIEEVFGQDIEPNYEVIMNEVNAEVNLSFETRSKLIHWLYYSKMRSPFMRNNTERLLKSINKTIESYRLGELSKEKLNLIKEQAKIAAKDIHLNTFSSEGTGGEIIKLYVETLSCKHWAILKSQKYLPFWTNDNPGFSPNMHPLFVKQFPYHHVMELNAHSIIFFPLSPKYCLEITPFEQGTPLDLCAMTMDIKYRQASLDYIEFINKGVLFTPNKIILSNNKEILERCVKMN